MSSCASTFVHSQATYRLSTPQSSPPTRSITPIQSNPKEGRKAPRDLKTEFLYTHGLLVFAASKAFGYLKYCIKLWLGAIVTKVDQNFPFKYCGGQADSRFSRLFSTFLCLSFGSVYQRLFLLPSICWFVLGCAGPSLSIALLRFSLLSSNAMSSFLLLLPVTGCCARARDKLCCGGRKSISSQ